MLTLEGFIRAEVLAAILLTTLLLALALSWRRELESEEARAVLESRIGLFKMALTVLFAPLLFVLVAEILEHLWRMSVLQRASWLEDTAELLEAGAFFVLNLGFLLSLYIAMIIRGRGHARG